MTITKKTLRPLLGTCLTLALLACNNSANTTKAGADTSKTDTATMAKATDTATPVTAAPAFVPFDVAEVSETVKDYAKWKPLFDSNAASRKAAGIETIEVSHIVDKPNMLQVVYQVADVQKAKAFYASPDLKAAMQKAGVVSNPDIELWHVIWFNPNSKEKQWVEVTHKVKDFAAWKKVYDAEGADKRKSEGMVDVVVGRSLADSNMVQLVFDITDMDKAKAAIASDEKKKTMMSAGVVGEPRILYYKQAE